ncbi:MAG: organic hydroperoxide resistance protein [Yaniella sp.]|uniref:organic hydroperoxide resistance protein n=1 Tax=Yaniella sp. TaxID=2773929 RepID=UPI0017A00B8A|nr:organic hydroperoxide resistance protein [Yaniella sp.]NLZ97889.1 organic hydroperoxide resistance protein [Micrococcus sp.]MDN5704067.1 organic hydroperoxide resistance protein [Yaniella sp.]MDN5731759.1 organic hydroperoxide resistance protein [Yaniella sp.]MDN5815603.1 organic hydroperoxide resistance protein [Yaniella sp.]MDN5818276.1 organic hydroperoxide resistance protein [Yaniella sp.]
MNTPENIAYTAKAEITGGRDGRGTTDDEMVDVSLRTPKEQGGPGGGANPEQLFAVGYGACFQSALGLAGKELGVDTTGSVVNTEVGIGKEGESFGLSIKLMVSIPNVEQETAQKVVDRTHELCPYSKAIRGNIPVEVLAV